MLEVLTKAGCFIAIIILGYVLKKVGVFKDSDFSVLSNVTLKITLPAAIINNFANKELDPSMFTLTLLAVLCGAVYMALGFLLNLRNSKEQRAFEILNFPGYNIGCFALPFVQSFLGPIGVISCCLFDIGNGFICLGGAYSVASMVKDGGKFSFRGSFAHFPSQFLLFALSLCPFFALPMFRSHRLLPLLRRSSAMQMHLPPC